SKLLSDSLISSQLSPDPGEMERSKFLDQLSQSHELPSISKLHRLWFELLREMIAEGRVGRYNAKVLQFEGSKPAEVAKPTDCVRVSWFEVIAVDEYLVYLSTVHSLTELDGVLPGKFRYIARVLTHTPEGPSYVAAVVEFSLG